jgi:hypothetical protein
MDFIFLTNDLFVCEKSLNTKHLLTFRRRIRIILTKFLSGEHGTNGECPNIFKSNNHVVVIPARGYNLKISARVGLGAHLVILI